MRVGFDLWVIMEKSNRDRLSGGSDRRSFIKQATGIFSIAVIPSALTPLAYAELSPTKPEAGSGGSHLVDTTLRINGEKHSLQLEPRTTLLDTMRDHLHLTGTKKGCDHGTCGACTVHIDGKRALSCLTLAVMAQNKEIRTIEGLADGDKLHPVQKAFIECDGFQCGFCTSGQIMSGVACIDEGHANSDDEIREWMSGNLCRCSAYPNIVDAIKMAATKGAA
jgi:xanthine dehydrogenase YagT iron-sulfur-binding subunit